MKKTIVIIISVLIVGGAIVGWAYFGREKPLAYDFIIAEKGEVVQEVNVTGRVKPAEDVELAFEKSGKVARVYVNVGEEVGAGALLVKLNNSELATQLAQKKAALESAKAKLNQYRAALEVEQAELDELERGTRPEEIQIAEVKVANAEKALADDQKNLENVESKADADLQEDYDSALFTVAKSVSVGLDALFTLTDIQYAHFSGFNEEGIGVANAKTGAIYDFLGAKDGGRLTNNSLNQLSGGVKQTVSQAQSDSIHENIDKALSEMKDAMESVETALNAIPLTSALTATETTNLDTAKSNIDDEVITIANKQQTIEVQKATNQSAVSSAQASVNDAQNALETAQSELSLKKAGSTAEQIAAQEAQMEQAEANIDVQEAEITQAQATVENIQAQLAKTLLYSPLAGIVTKKEAKAGEIVAANATVISIISNLPFEIEANIAEVDIAKVKVGNVADLTLDAYGADTIFGATVTAIEPAETMVEGVATYKTTIQFIEEDERVKSGMTANVDILTAKREDVIVVPQRTVFTKNGEKIARVVAQDGTIKEVKVQTGLRGSDGTIEITDGIKEGDKVIVFMKDK